MTLYDAIAVGVLLVVIAVLIREVFGEGDV